MNTFEVFHIFLSISGISIYAKENWDTKLWWTLQTFNFIVGIFCFIFATGFVITNHNDLVTFVEGACVWASGVILMISLGVCFIYRGEFRKFLDEMGFRDAIRAVSIVRCVFETERGKKLQELKELVENSQKRLLEVTMILLQSYVFIDCFVLALYLTNPIYEMVVRKDESLRLFAFEMWFPWSLDDFRIFVASFVFNTYSAFLGVIVYPGVQLTIFLLVGQVIRQLVILRYILTNLNDLVEEIVVGSAVGWQDCCTDVLIQCFKHYIKLKNFSNSVNVICRPFYLSLILVAMLVVCMCSVEIAISVKLSPGTMKYYGHAFIFVMMVLMFTMLGQQVDNECEKLELCCTENWYIFNRNHIAGVRIIKIALSQRMPIYIFGSVTLSLPTFTWFVKTGLSFFTLVMSFLEN